LARAESLVDGGLERRRRCLLFVGVLGGLGVGLALPAQSLIVGGAVALVGCAIYWLNQ
jgi:hypothetical protein